MCNLILFSLNQTTNSVQIRLKLQLILTQTLTTEALLLHEKLPG